MQSERRIPARRPGRDLSPPNSTRQDPGRSDPRLDQNDPEPKGIKFPVEPLSPISVPSSPGLKTAEDETRSPSKLRAGTVPKDESLPGLRQEIWSLLGYTEKLAGHRESEPSLRNQTQTAWQICARNLDFVREAHNNFLLELEAQLDFQALKDDTTIAGLNTLHASVCENHREQRQGIQALHELETQLQRLGGKQTALDRKIEQSAHLVRDLLGHSGPIENNVAAGAGGSEASSSHASTASRPALPSLVEHYLDKFGDMKIERDKLYDLDQVFAEEKAYCQLGEDQRLPLESSDEDFEGYWLRVFAEAEVNPVDSRREVELARTACNRENIDPEAWRRKLSKSPDEESVARSDSGAPLPPSHRAGIPLDAVDTAADQPLPPPIEKRGSNGFLAADPFASPSEMQKESNRRQMEWIYRWVDEMHAFAGLDDVRSQPRDEYEPEDQLGASQPQSPTRAHTALADPSTQYLDSSSPSPLPEEDLGSVLDNEAPHPIDVEQLGPVKGRRSAARPKQRIKSTTSRMGSAVKGPDGEGGPAAVNRTPSEPRLSVQKPAIRPKS